MDDLVSILTRAKVVNRLLDFMPQSRRSPEEFQAHFKVCVHDVCVCARMRKVVQ